MKLLRQLLNSLLGQLAIQLFLRHATKAKDHVANFCIQLRKSQAIRLGSKVHSGVRLETSRGVIFTVVFYLRPRYRCYDIRIAVG
jgi:hypothetical protein